MSVVWYATCFCKTSHAQRPPQEGIDGTHVSQNKQSTEGRAVVTDVSTPGHLVRGMPPPRMLVCRDRDSAREACRHSSRDHRELLAAGSALAVAVGSASERRD